MVYCVPLAGRNPDVLIKNKEVKEMSLLQKMKDVFSDKKQSDGLSSAQQKLLSEAFASLAPAGKNLPAKAMRYLLEGVDEDVLLDLQNAGSPHPGILLGEPGRLRSSFSGYDNKVEEKNGESSLKARSAFYATLDAETMPHALMVRLGKLLQSADGRKSLEPMGSLVPDWCDYLVNDALYASFNRSWLSSDDKKAFPHDRRAFTVPNLAIMLELEGVPDWQVLQLAFERNGLDNYYQDRLDFLISNPATFDFMLSKPELVKYLPSNLSALGRTKLAECLGARPAENELLSAILVLLAVDGAKAVRAEAASHLEGVPERLRLGCLAGFLLQGDSGQRQYAAELFARWPSAAVKATLEAALAQEKGKSVQQAIRGALSRIDAVDEAAAQDLPPLPAWTPLPDEPLGPEFEKILLANRVELLESLRQGAEEEKKENAARDWKSTWQQTTYKEYMQLTDAHLRVAVQVMNGQPASKQLVGKIKVQVWKTLDHQDKFLELPGLSGVHLIRWLNYADAEGDFWRHEEFQQWLTQQEAGTVDLRAIADVVQRNGGTLTAVASAALVDYWRAPTATEFLPPDCVWPFFAEHPEFIDIALEIAAPAEFESYRGTPRLGATLRTLEIFPVIPGRWLPRLMEIALGETRAYRGDAQKVLARVPEIGKQVLEFLTHSKSEMRIEAARWLADLQYQPAVDAIRKALVKESREAVRAAFLTTLEELGADIAAYIAPDVLLAEAKKGLKAKLPSGLDWFNLDSLPACQWADGTPVEAECIKWWVVFACKLKEPGGNALLTRYLGLLDAASREALGRYILHQFIAQDIRHPSEAECIAHADATAPRRWQQWQTYYQRNKDEFYNRSQEQIYAECKASKAAEYLGSAIGEKGILALSAYAPGHEAVNLLRQYMRDHYPRRAQIEAMLEGLAPGNDPFVIQLLLGLSRRYRTASVQEKARLLVQQIADRNGWSADQLADRTIPTAGFDDSGKLELHYGDRLFTVTLDAAMKPELRNAEGKVIKALPEPRQTDDPDSIKEAKGQFSGCKKELKQVIELQTARLYEALCVSRLWPQAEWREYLLQHPVVGRLIQRLIWLETDAQGQPLQSFRPTEDGTLINTDDDEVTLNEGSLIRLAHASLVTPDSAKAWQAHFKDYKLSPLFAQMTRPLPEIAMTDAEGKPVQEIADRQGWLSDTFTLRGAFNKLGYQRAAAEDAGFFDHYFKEFGAAGIRVVVAFTGNCLPEENVAAALRVLRFEDTRGGRWRAETLDLAAVPVVLLAEAYADYLAVANVCSGFDPEWEKKSPWY